MSFNYNDIEKIYNKIRLTNYKNNGTNASYIPELANVDPKIYAISVCNIKGELMNFGDYTKEVGIESVSKVFTLALALKKNNIATLLDKIGNNNEKHAFNSLTDVIHTKQHTVNSFVNAGAMATTSLLYNNSNTESKESNEKRIDKEILKNMENFAGRKLQVNKKLYLSELANYQHNKKLIDELMKFNCFYGEPDVILKNYTKQCSVMVTSKDIAVMAATLANCGKNPVTKKIVVTDKNTEYIIEHMATHGLYNESPKWWKQTFLPAKSGVGGIIMIVIPGLMGIGIVSPPLNKYGNSVKGIETGKMIANLPIEL